MMKKIRLDMLLTERGLAESRTQAQRLIMAGKVRVDMQVVLKPSEAVLPQALIQVDSAPKFVSRGGEKLEAALKQFELSNLEGIVCVDVGASTGGFTDCLLQYGARRIYAVDVGYGILHWKLRNDARVVVMEKTNARYIENLPETPELVTVDASFISLKILFPVIRKWFEKKPGKVITLVKPQFEAGKAEVDRGDGVITDPQVHRRVLKEVIEFANAHGFYLVGLMRSPLRGPKGNVEFLAYFLTTDGASQSYNPIDEGLFESLLD